MDASMSCTDKHPCSLVRAMWDYDVGTVIAAIHERFGVVVDESDVMRWLGRFDPERVNWCWSEGTAFMWLKNRLDQDGIFTAIIGGVETDIRCWCSMHLFFLHVQETPEQLARLRNEPNDSDVSPARSTISKSCLANIFPIDKTAAVVVPQIDGDS